jgi:aconitate hydratase
MRDGLLGDLVHAGARLHQTGCNGCIGMGQAPASNQNSLRTVPRNFPGRSGTPEDRVFLCSPETATASALTGRITDPRSLKMDYPRVAPPEDPVINTAMLVAPVEESCVHEVELQKGPNIGSFPTFDELPEDIEAVVLLKVGDNVSTDEILPAGAKVLPYRSNLPRISEFAFDAVDKSYSERAKAEAEDTAHIVVGGENYGQGSSREHAALAPRFLGLRIVIAKSFARIHWQNLVNFGVLPLEFTTARDYEILDQGEILSISRLRSSLSDGKHDVCACIKGADRSINLRHRLNDRQRQIILAGSLVNWYQKTYDAA